jgi:hypothetical protein
MKTLKIDNKDYKSLHLNAYSDYKCICISFEKIIDVTMTNKYELGTNKYSGPKEDSAIITILDFKTLIGGNCTNSYSFNFEDEKDALILWEKLMFFVFSTNHSEEIA